MTRTQDTSREAYRLMLPRLKRDLAEVVSYLMERPQGATADEARRDFNLKSPNQIAPRFTALKDMGVVEDSGMRRTTELGRSAIVWVLARTAAETPARWDGCSKSLSGWHHPQNASAGTPCELCGERRP